MSGLLKVGRAYPLAVTGVSTLLAFTIYKYTLASSPLLQENVVTEPRFKGLPPKWVDLPLDRVEDLTKDTKKFVFRLPSDNEMIKPMSFMLTKPSKSWGFFWNIRPYTPININDMDKKELVFVIKHMPQGKMSSHLFSLKPNDTVSFAGPVSKYVWNSKKTDSVLLLAGGSGITPMVQLMDSILKDNGDNKTKITVMFSNKTQNDIILKSQLDKIQSQHADRVQIHYFVTNGVSSASKNLKQGYITADDIIKFAPKPEEDTHVFVCGPDSFVKAYAGKPASLFSQGPLGGILKQLGYSKSQVTKL